MAARDGGPGFTKNGWRGANPARSAERQAIGACAAYAEGMWRVVESLERALKPTD